MPKIRTNKTAVKRFKISGTGKIIRTKAYNSHQFLHKRSAQKRRLEQEPEVFRGELRRMRRLLVLAHTRGKDKAAVDPNVDQAAVLKAKRDEKAKADRAKLVSMVTRG